MSKFFFSIIIPTLNEEKYLPRLLTSLSKQTFRTFEVIIVDGRSEDGTKEEFLKKRKELPQSTFITSEKRNVSFQRNLGAGQAKGDYLVFLDGDTMIGTDFLEILKNKIDREGFLFATTWIVPDTKKMMDRFLLYMGNVGLSIAGAMNIPLAGGYSTIIERKIFYKLGGFRPEIIYNEDYEFSLNARKRNIKLKILRDPKVVYSTRRFHSEGLLKLIPKMIGGQLYMFFIGPITTDIFKYKMGGKAHDEALKNRKAWVLTAYRKTTARLEKQVMRFFEE
ncbi:hypothetical protein A3D77_00655 [Candidatus Gottesmanbacteria bacterium RIFCSPHIGHO2_02_FULL_39_11]|uniref:Glycosyltransferase 2-like domain-containing protein n=1 Tax=Candidatus Gottesmanbacteria bacterium RIFCSPHIGHO2_02_FULL_39_11 TaxID=1798382 RepID=A0A1F5ZL48_9BACT|nr:MAG: hypothetical protein A3D77_00655 [Candidatus Gottesmanbacteria bacterium RIFCSPHIGHO2_02_FULL_39_11]